MMLFRESDKRVRTITRDDPDWAEHVDPDDTDLESFEIVRYVAPASVIRDRMELMGFTLRATVRAFNAAIHTAAREHASAMFRIASSLPADFLDEDGRILTELTAESWMDGLREIRERGMRPTYRSDPELQALPPLLRYMLGRHFDGWYGFPGADVRHVIRLGVEVCPEDELIYDLTDLVLGGYFDSSDDVVADADYLLRQDFEATRRVIVLTEGATDKWILERSLRLLYPHLAEFYTFMDFEGARVAGGAGALASMVKAFVGAGILNRVVALFDNDTAGSAAMRLLDPVRMPRNIVVLQYPPLPIAAAYPTIGPSGDVEMDVNGLAASIELYLGADALSDGGKLTPVQWKGFDEGSRRYQGEILGKRLVHERFARRLVDCEACREHIGRYDWEGVRVILKRLFSAFHNVDEEELVAAAERAD